MWSCVYVSVSGSVSSCSPPSKCFCAFFKHHSVFCCGIVFFSAFFSSRCVFFPLLCWRSQVLQIFITISGFLRTSLINFPQNLVLLLRGQ